MEAMSAAEATAALAAQLLDAGVRPGAVLLVHTSLSAVGRRVPGGADTVIDALLQALGRDGTLCLPTLSYLFTTEAEPVFDVKNTPTNLGAIPEAFRQRDGVLRSLHPTHSVACFGPKASELVHGHEDDRSPVGANSPFRKVRDMGGQVAFLGCPCGARCNTSCHGIEELLEVPPPYLFKESKISYTVIDANGASTTQEQHSRHDFDGTGQRYERVLDLLTLGSERSQGKVGGATMHVLDAQAMWANTLAALRADPLSLVQPIEPGAENHWIKKGSSGGIRYHVGASAPE